MGNILGFSQSIKYRFVFLCDFTNNKESDKEMKFYECELEYSGSMDSDGKIISEKDIIHIINMCINSEIVNDVPHRLDLKIPNTLENISLWVWKTLSTRLLCDYISVCEKDNPDYKAVVRPIYEG